MFLCGVLKLDRLSRILKSTLSFLVMLILAILFRSLAFEPFHIPSGSMKSTLLIGDYVLVSKYAYGYSKYSFPFAPNIFSGRIFFKQVEPGDVVVFRPPNDPSINYVKRVIGIPGDKVQIKNGSLYINGVVMKHEQIPDFFDDSLGVQKNIRRYLETLYNGKSYEILDEDNSSPLDNTPVYQVPEGAIFVLGDNRDNSRDSRFVNDIGFIPFENIVGKALVTALSFAKSHDSFIPFKIRMDRVWHVIK